MQSQNQRGLREPAIPIGSERRRIGSLRSVLRRKSLVFLIGLALVTHGFSLAAAATPPQNLKVLYIGDPGTPRAQQFEGFLRQHATRVEVVARDRFAPAAAKDFDVVLLDWPQS